MCTTLFFFLCACWGGAFFSPYAPVISTTLYLPLSLFSGLISYAASIDQKSYKLPNKFILPSIIVGFFIGITLNSLPTTLLGGALGLILLLLPLKNFGGGDAKLIIAIGLALGFTNSYYFLLLSCLILLAQLKFKKSKYVAAGPAIVFSGSLIFSLQNLMPSLF